MNVANTASSPSITTIRRLALKLRRQRLRDRERILHPVQHAGGERVHVVCDVQLEAFGI